MKVSTGEKSHWVLGGFSDGFGLGDRVMLWMSWWFLIFFVLWQLHSFTVFSPDSWKL